MADVVPRPSAPELAVRLRTLLPELYEVFDDAVQPVSMGSAGLRFGPDGLVEWDRMWRSFCDLAMAGGPPHRGTLLQPDPTGAGTARYTAVTNELCRGLALVTGLCAEPAPIAGFVRLYCPSAAMAGWLLRAITMENLSASASGLALDLPAGAGFRVEKEIKNVITSVAKTVHYWEDHTSESQQEQIAALLRTMDRQTPLLRPRWKPDGTPETSDELKGAVAKQATCRTGLEPAPEQTPSWAGLRCETVAEAIGTMRALLALNVLARREGTTVFAPLDPVADLGGQRVAEALEQALEFARSTSAPSQSLP